MTLCHCICSAKPQGRRIPDRRGGKQHNCAEREIAVGVYDGEDAAKVEEKDKSGRPMVYVPCIGIGKGGDFHPYQPPVHDVLYWRFQRSDGNFSE